MSSHFSWKCASAIASSCLVLSLVPVSAWAASGPAGAYEDGTILVGYAPGTSAGTAALVAARMGAVDLKTIGAGTHQLEVTPGNVDSVLAGLRKHPSVRYAEPNYILRASTLPNDPGIGQLWGLNDTGQPVNGSAGTPGADIDAPQAWAVTTGSRSIVVGVVDTGVDYTHPDLAQNIYTSTVPVAGCPAGTHGYNAIASTCDPMDDNNHGTHVAGTIGAVGNNGIGVSGVNWTVSIMGLKFLDATGSGTTANAVIAIDFAVQARLAGVNVRALNASWGGPTFSQALLDEINKAAANDILFVAAAGNNAANNDITPTYPASYQSAKEIAVAATDQNDSLASFSNYGPNSVDLGAPGANILSTIRGSTYAFFSGTSMATPHVTGAAALILSAIPSLTATQLKSTILSSVDADPGLAGRTSTGGRLNVCKALPSCGAVLSITPASLAFGGPVGTNAAAQTLTVQNAGTAGMTWYASASTSSGGNWLLVSPVSGSLNPAGSTSLQVGIQASTLAAGTYSGTITFTAGHARGSPATVPVTINIAPATWKAVYNVSAVPTTWAANQTQTFSVAVTNTGNQTWPAGGPNPVHLGMHFSTGSGLSPAYWLSDQRFNLPADLAPGANVTLTVSVTAPASTGAIVLEARMVKEWQFWFDQSAPVSVTLAPATLTASYNVGGVPTSWAVNQTQTFPLTITNTGNQLWPAGGANPVHLGMHFSTGAGLSPAYWLSDQRFGLPADLAPGTSVTLTVAVTAPENTGATVLEARMVKEWQFWFDQSAPVSISLAPATWTASYNVGGVPTSWANQTQTFPVTITNTGNQLWPAGGANPVHLGMHFSTGAGLSPGFWLTDQRFNLPADLAPGSSVTLTVSVTAPASPGATVLEARMVKEWQFWFDHWAPVSITLAPATWTANYNISGVPTSWAVNQTQTFPVTVTNTGNQTWPAGGPNPVHLGMHFGAGAGLSPGLWLTDQRFNLPADLAPGASVTLMVTAIAPSSTGATVLEARMVKEWQFWFDQSAPTSISLSPATWTASYNVSSVPTSWAVNQTQTFTVTVTNTGNQTWPSGGPNPVHLGMHFSTGAGLSPAYWLTDQRFTLPADPAPGASVTLTVSVTAPPSPGSTVLEARMVKEWQFWFDQSAPVSVTMKAS